MKQHTVKRDYSGEVRVARSPVNRALLLGSGHLFVGLAVLGVFLPIMPTTVFLLIAAACYVRASARFYNWLLNNKLFGPIILDWRRHRAMRRKHKITAIVLIVLTIGSSAIFVVPQWYAKVILAAIGAGVIIFLLSIPTRRLSGVAEANYRSVEFETE